MFGSWGLVGKEEIEQLRHGIDDMIAIHDHQAGVHGWITNSVGVAIDTSSGSSCGWMGSVLLHRRRWDGMEWNE